MADKDRTEKDRKRRRRPRPPRPRVRRIARGMAATVGAVALAAVIVVVAMDPPWRTEPVAGPSTSVTTTTPAPAPAGTIDVPRADAAVAGDVAVSGTLRDMPAGSTAWLVTRVVGPASHVYWQQHPDLPDRIWPAPQPLAPLASGGWRTVLPIEDRDYYVDGLRLQVSLVVVEASVDASFREYNGTAERRRHPGISPIPDGLTVLDEVEIVLERPPVIL